MGKRINALAWALLALAASGQLAGAQTPGNGPTPGNESGDTNAANVVSYPNDFFAGSGANTALDLIRRTPGFSYNPGQAQVRGLAGAAGNVLIDGQVQTSKSISLDEALTRIPTAQVERIDVVRAGAGGIDMGGFPIVANVIRRSGAESRITAQVSGKAFFKEAEPDFAGRLEWSRKSGNLQLDATLEASDRETDDQIPGGVGDLKRRYVSGLNDDGPFVLNPRQKTVAANTSAEYRGGQSRYRGTLGVEHRFNVREENSFVAAPELFLLKDDMWQIEGGANLERTLSPTLTARVDALQSLQRLQRSTGFNGRLTPSEANSGESILRGSLALRRWDNLSFEAAAEGAFNFLEQELTLGFANSNVRVEERRVQPSLTMNWQVFEPFALELGARYETSTITQSGDTNSEHSFSFFKPRAIAVVDLTELTQLRFRAEREVSQLVFADFAANGGNMANQAVAGNSNRVPERAWTYEAAFEQRLWDRSVFVFTYTHQDVEEVVDRIPIGNSEGNGNAGDGARDIYAIDLKVALDPLGIRGGRFEFLPKYTNTEVVDPYSGRVRNISGMMHWRGNLNFYLDRPEWKSTFALEGNVGYVLRDWRREQASKAIQPPYLYAWWERALEPGASLRATLFNIGGRTRTRDRAVFTGARSTAPLLYQEDRLIKRGMGVQLTLRKTY